MKHLILKGWKQLAVLGAMAAVLALGVTTAFAHGDDGRNTSTAPISWSIPAGQCSVFPADATVSGAGTITRFFEEKMHRDGTITRIYRDRAEGTATDGDGNTYRFTYDNSTRVRNSAGNPDLFVGTMVDSFELKGRGPLRTRSGFIADYTESADLAHFSIIARRSYGDPIAFGDETQFASHCDPI
jgi:hypothetical protein